MDIIYRIGYPEYFERNTSQILPHYCKDPQSLQIWLIQNNVIEPIISQLNSHHHNINIWSRARELTINDFNFSQSNDSYYEEDFSIEISLKKDIFVTKQVTERVPAVMNPGEPYQPETIKIVEEYDYLLSKEVFCVIHLEAERCLK